jgi:hypothetical protein
VTFLADVSALTVDEKCRATTGVDAPAGPLASASPISVWPNPVHGEATIGLRLDEPARVRLEVHDAAGRHRWTIAERSLPGGAHSLQWTDVSRVVPCAGIYFLSVIRDGRVSACRSIVIL